MNNYLTGYTGIQLTDNNYTAGLLGLGMNTPVGLFLSMLLTQMSAFRTIKPIKDKATVFRNKLFENTSTSLNIAAYRYSTQHYLGLNDALTLIDEVEHPEQELEPKSMRNYSRMKNQVTVSINQPLKFEKRITVHFISREAGQITGPPGKTVLITLLVIAIVRPGQLQYQCSTFVE